jgi:hypothetical protein
MLKTLSRLVLMTASQSGLPIFLKVMSRVIPALFTNTSMGEIWVSIFFTASAQESKLLTSHA